MKTIIYTAKRKIEVVEESTYKDVKYAILNLGTHPTAYVENIVGASDYNSRLIEDIGVHGGFTYCDTPRWITSEDVVYLGWDYAHLGDYVCGVTDLYDFECKKWTYVEILTEVYSVIDQLLELKERLKNDKM